MATYTKAYTRENTLFSIQVWEEHQGHLLEKFLDENVPVSIFDVRGGVASVYYHEDIFPIWRELILRKSKSDLPTIERIMEAYNHQIDVLEETWKRGQFSTREELVSFFSVMALSWVGVSVTYILPEVEEIDQRYQDMGMELRRRSADFLDNTDKVIYATLRELYPNLGDLVKYLTFEEISANSIPPLQVLNDRQSHYLYVGFKLYTEESLEELASRNDIVIKEEEVPEGLTELRGQTAMTGTITGRVRVLHSKSEIGTLIEGEVLVTAMTTPDYLPAMYKASAFITDEGAKIRRHINGVTGAHS